MTPSDRLKEIEDLNFMPIDDDKTWLIDRVKKLTKALELALSFCPKGPVPKDLGPMFYHTLNYEDEVKLQDRIDNARKALEADE